MLIDISSCNEVRAAIKAAAEQVAEMQAAGSDNSEAMANVVLAYRHLEDASMRLGKVIQALDGGISVYDKVTTVGA